MCLVSAFDRPMSIILSQWCKGPDVTVTYILSNWRDFLSSVYPPSVMNTPYASQWGISHWLGSGLSSEVPELRLSQAWAEPSVWTRFSSEFQCRLGISDPSCRICTLVAQLMLGLESEPRSELSHCEIPHGDRLCAEQWCFSPKWIIFFEFTKI